MLMPPGYGIESASSTSSWEDKGDVFDEYMKNNRTPYELGVMNV